MFLKVLNKGFIGSNSYILGDAGDAVVIDAGNNADDIVEAAVTAGMRIKYIILTHGHIDHMQYLDELQRKTNAKVAIHEKDAAALTDAVFNVSNLFGMDKTFKDADILLKEGDCLQVGSLELNIFHTPGHTPGGICIQCGELLFTGDTLFDGDYGRTDMPHGSTAQLKESLERLFQMNQELMVYPGHDNGNKLKYIVAKCRAGNLIDEY